MQIEEPIEATKAIMAIAKNLDLQTMQDMIVAYMKLHNVTLDEMMLYPNGERVVTPEMFD